MPAPNQIQGIETSKNIKDLFEQKGNGNLAREISELRSEISELRAELAPIPTLIITGKDVLGEFKKLRPGV